MKEFQFSGMPVDAQYTDAYDPDYPTKQTELLSLGLRRFLQGLQYQNYANTGVVIRQTDATETNFLESAMLDTEAIGEAITSYISGVHAPGGLTEIPAIGSLINTITLLVPAIVSGGVSLSSLLPVILPHILEMLLHIAKNRLSVATESGGLQDIAETLSDISDKLSSTTDEISIADVVLSLSESVTEVVESLDSIDRLLQEFQEGSAVAIMRTSELDKIVYIEP